MTLDFRVDAGDPRTLYQAFGDPRKFDRFDPSKLQSGDYAIIVNAQPGAIYFLRTRDGKEPRDAFQGDVIMTHLLLGRPSFDEKGEYIGLRPQNGKATLSRLVENYQLERRDGPDLDGVYVPFYVLRESTKE